MRERERERGCDEAYDNPHDRHVVFHSLLPKTSQNSTPLSLSTIYLQYFAFFLSFSLCPSPHIHTLSLSLSLFGILHITSQPHVSLITLFHVILNLQNNYTIPSLSLSLSHIHFLSLSKSSQRSIVTTTQSPHPNVSKTRGYIATTTLFHLQLIPFFHHSTPLLFLSFNIYIYIASTHYTHDIYLLHAIKNLPINPKLIESKRETKKPQYTQSSHKLSSLLSAYTIGSYIYIYIYPHILYNIQKNVDDGL